MFNESQQIFGLGGDADRSEELLARLGDYEKGERPIKARVDLNNSVVTWLDEPTDKERAAFEEARVLLDNPEPIHDVRVAEIDPNVFNIVDLWELLPTFKLCIKIIPREAF